MFGLQQLKRARLQLGLTQAQLAKQCGVSQSLITKLEQGKIDPKYSTVRRIQETVGRLQSAEQRSVAAVMQRRILAAAPGERVPHLLRRMQQAGISQVPVMEGRHVAGLVTESTLLEAVAEGRQLGKLTAAQVMVEAPPMIPSTTPLSTAVQLLEHAPIIVVTEKGSVVGIVARADLLKAAL